MREIKFRAWDKEDSEMVTWDDFPLIYPQQPLISLSPDLYKNLEFMQYTGLEDKNGVEIYEGDIVKHPHYYRNGPVIFDTWYSRFAVEADEDDESLPLNKHIFSTEVEVIGNIYENPELLGASHE